MYFAARLYLPFAALLLAGLWCVITSAQLQGGDATSIALNSTALPLEEYCPDATRLDDPSRPIYQLDNYINNAVAVRSCSGATLNAKRFVLTGRGQGVRINVCSELETKLLAFKIETPPCYTKCIREGNTGSEAYVHSSVSISGSSNACPLNRFASTLAFFAESNTVYVIAVAGRTSTRFSMTITPNTVPFPLATTGNNWRCDTSRALTIPTVIQDSLDFAGVDSKVCSLNRDNSTNITSAVTSEPKPSLWYYIVGANRGVILEICRLSSTMVPEVSIYEAPNTAATNGARCVNATCLRLDKCSTQRVASNRLSDDKAEIRFYGRQGYAYYIQVSNTVPWKSGRFSLAISNVEAGSNVSSGDLKIAQSTAVQTAVVRGGRLLAQAATEFPDLTIFATANGPETEDLIESFVQFRLPSISEQVVEKKVIFAIASLVGGAISENSTDVAVGFVQQQIWQSITYANRPEPIAQLTTLNVTSGQDAHYEIDMTELAQQAQRNDSALISISLKQEITQTRVASFDTTVFSNGKGIEEPDNEKIKPTLTVYYLSTEPSAVRKAQLVSRTSSSTGSSVTLTFQVPYLNGSSESSREAKAVAAVLKFAGWIEDTNNDEAGFVGLYALPAQSVSSISNTLSLGTLIAKTPLTRPPAQYRFLDVTEFVKSRQDQNLTTMTMRLQCLGTECAAKQLFIDYQPELHVFF